jgi:hypothetical protein
MTEKPIGHCTLEVLAVLAHVIPGEDRIPIYIAPPKREWVGLTDEDWAKVADMPDLFDQGVAWAQARLKEKNT